MRENALQNKRNFTFETVLSSSRNVDLLKRAKDLGYRVEVIFVLTSNEEINVSRVKNRVKNGGHDVPEDKIRSRYHKSLANLSEIFKFADIIWTIDNSTDKAELIVQLKDSKITIYETPLWSFDKINKLICGNLDK